MSNNNQSNFLKALRGEKTERIPVWFMRQAGRSLPDYSKIKGNLPIFEVLKDPEICAKITILPSKYYDIDALVLFSDIIAPLIQAGIGFELEKNIGPVKKMPYSHERELGFLRKLDKSELVNTIETILEVKRNNNLPIIGFCGGPFTLACYLIEGKSSKTWAATRAFIYQHPREFDELIQGLTTLVISFLDAQIDSGVDAVQIFDSWVGSISDAIFRKHLYAPLENIANYLRAKNTASIYFSLASFHLLDQFSNLPFNALGLDEKVPLSLARELFPSKALQGNLDPVLCLTDFKTVKQWTLNTLNSFDTSYGYIFNLGHGVLPNTSYKILDKLVDLVHNYQ